MSSPPTPAAKHDPYLALRFRNFRLFFFASIFGVIVNGLQHAVLGWELYERTSDPLVLGNLGLFEFLPILLLALPAGHIADRFDRKTIAILGWIIEVLAALWFAYLSWTRGDIWMIYAATALTSVARAFHGAAASALVPASVPAHAFSNAVTWQMGSYQFAGMLSRFIAGPLLAYFLVVPAPAVGSINIGATIGYVITAVLCLAILACIALVDMPAPPRTNDAATLSDVLAGARFVFREKLVLSAITLDLFAVLFGGAVALMPVFARDVLNAGPIGYSLLSVAPAIGALIMSIVLTRLPPIQNAGKTLLWVVTGFGVATIVFAVSQNLVLSVVALALTGALDNISMVIRGALVPLRTPDHMRGRVSAVERVFISSSNELGAWESGVTARWWGAVTAVIVGGVGTLIVVGLVALGFPQLRALGALDKIEPAESEAEASATVSEKETTPSPA
jgi:MFS family permease